MDKEDRLRLQHMHLTLLAIQHALAGSRHPDMKAWDQWMRAEGAIAQGSVNIPLTEASPEFHYSLPAEKDLRSLSHEGLGKALHEAMDARSGAIREDENDPNSPIIDYAYRRKVGPYHVDPPRDGSEKPEEASTLGMDDIYRRCCNKYHGSYFVSVVPIWLFPCRRLPIASTRASY